MRDTLWLIRRTMLVMARDYKSMLIFLLAPVIGIVLAFLIYGGDQDAGLTVGVVNLDAERRVTQDIVYFLDGIEHVEVSLIEQPEHADAQVMSGELDAAVILPSGFAQGLLEGAAESASAELVALEGSVVGPFIRSYLDRYIGNAAAIAAVAQGDAAAFDARYADYRAAAYGLSIEETEDRSAQRDMTNRSIGYLVVFMMFAAINLSVFMIKERENRTYYRLLASPVSGRAYVGSNVAANMALMIVQIAIVLAVMVGAFRIDPGIPLWHLALMLVLFAWVAVGLSLVIVAFSASSMTAMAIQNVLIIPTCLLAGCMFPIEAMPESLRAVSAFLPQRWLLDAIDKLQLGASPASLATNALTLLAFALAFSLIAAYKFGSNKDTRTYI